MNRQIIADIYLGKLSNWNNAQLATLNPGVALPNLPPLRSFTGRMAQVQRTFSPISSAVFRHYGCKG